MRNLVKSKYYLLCILVVVLTFVVTCEKTPEPPDGKGSWVAGTLPAVKAGKATEVTFTGAKVNVELTNTGGRQITKLLLCYSPVKEQPDTTDQTINLGQTNETGIFSASLSNLTHNTKYYYRAFARNQIGYVYSSIDTCRTQKDTRLPEVTTGAATQITTSSVTLPGSITGFGQASTAIQHGHVWATHSNPTLSDNKNQLGSTSNTTFTSEVTDLAENTQYYYRAYATNNFGTGYSTIGSFTTYGNPVVVTDSISLVTRSSFRVYGNVTETGGTSITEYGVYYSLLPNPSGDTLVKYTSSITGNYSIIVNNLRANTKYYVKAYAKNQYGEGLGSELNITTLQPDVPVVSTSSVTSVYYDTAVCGGSITSDGGGDITARGVCWSTEDNPTTDDNKTVDGTGTGIFVSHMTGLVPGTLYYVRAYAINASGTGYGPQRSFTTTATSSPFVTTTAITSITKNSAISGGNVTSEGGSSVTARGVCWSTSSTPTIDNDKTTEGTGTGAYTSTMTGLNPTTTYYVRAYATNSNGTGYGSQLTFMTGSSTPTVTTTTGSGISATGATSGGNITYEGDSPVTARGVCWNTTGSPTVADNKTEDGSGTGTYVSTLTGLTPSTTYYIRAYATNNEGTSYGSQTSITTLAALPVLTTTAATNITATTVETGGNITYSGGGSIIERGVCWNTTGSPTVSDTKTTSGVGAGEFTVTVTGLTASTTYYMRAYATNSYGTSYGGSITVTTLSALPTVQTTSASSITYNTAVSGGDVTYQGQSVVTARGVCWSELVNPTLNDNYTNDGTGTGTFTSDITGLSPDTKYFVRAYATNSQGTSYGSNIYFTTLSDLPTLTTATPSSITYTTAISGGDISDQGLSEVIERGVCWNTTGSPTTDDTKTSDGSGTGTFVSEITSLDPATTYYIRAYATNSEGTGYGDELTFMTTSPDAWSQLTYLNTGYSAGSVGFTIGDKLYVLAKSDANDYYKFLWEYDPAYDSWTRKADFVENIMAGGIGFSVNGKGYVGLGWNSTNFLDKNEFYEYDPGSNTWTKKADFTGGNRNNAIAFVINDKAYVGLGERNTYYKDLWEFDPVLNQWTQKANYAGNGRDWTVSFSVDNDGYVGLGHYWDGAIDYTFNDFWKYIVSSDSWIKVSDFTGSARTNAVGTSDGINGYVQGSNEIWQYDPTLNNWTEKATPPSNFLNALSIGSKCYFIGTDEFWEYNPAYDNK